jgi:hypothetical protein
VSFRQDVVQLISSELCPSINTNKSSFSNIVSKPDGKVKRNEQNDTTSLSSSHCTNYNRVDKVRGVGWGVKGDNMLHEWGRSEMLT